MKIYIKTSGGRARQKTKQIIYLKMADQNTYNKENKK